MSDIKILVATHKKYEMPEESIYLPIHVGREGKDDLGYIGDNTGDNISLKNKNYCELTGLYWAWKNLDSEYVGLSHYRRFFTVRKPLEIMNGNRKFILNKGDLEKILNEYDVILPKKRNYYIESVYSHYKNAHFIKDLNIVRQIIEEKHPTFLSSFDKIMSGKTLHLYNMFVMNKQNFDQYCEWLFDILFELEERVDLGTYDNYQSRIFGFISERLFNVWLEESSLKTKEINILSMERVKWGNKIGNFLKRKF